MLGKPVIEMVLKDTGRIFGLGSKSKRELRSGEVRHLLELGL